MVGIVALTDTSRFGGMKAGEFKAHPTKRMKKEVWERPDLAVMVDESVYLAIVKAVSNNNPGMVTDPDNADEKQE